MAGRILSISKDPSLLGMRHVLLKEAGYTVVSAIGLRAGLIHCSAAKFELVILGHSIPRQEKLDLLREIRNLCSTPVLSLYRADEGPIPGVDFTMDANQRPEALLALIEQIFKRVA